MPIKSALKFFHGDCLQVMHELIEKGVKVDAIITDPPYGATACEWDSVIPLDVMWSRLFALRTNTAPVVLFSVQPFTTELIVSNLKNFSYELIWKKNVPTGMATAKYRPMRYHENVDVFFARGSTYNPIMKERVGVGKECYRYEHYCGKNNHVPLKKVKSTYNPDFVQPSSVLEFDVVPSGAGKMPPALTSVSLMEFLVKTFTNEGDTVLDFAMGSGTTGVACVRNGRKFIGIELNEKYFDIACRRIEAESKQLKFDFKEVTK